MPPEAIMGPTMKSSSGTRLGATKAIYLSTRYPSAVDASEAEADDAAVEGDDPL